MKKEKAPIIISVGGSLIVQDKVNSEFLKSLTLTIRNQIQKGERFILVTGGGKVCRNYQEAIYNFYPNNKTLADWIGIHTTILNAHLLKLIFQDLSYDKLVGNPEEKYDWQTPILIGAGYEPGHSTDYDTVKLALTYGANKIINLSNIDYVYDTDPRINPNAKKFENVSWEEFLNFIPKEWTPGLNSPFDPTAARLAQENSIEVAMINGFEIERLNNYLEGRDFIGTKIY